MARARILEATRHERERADDTVRIFVQFTTDAGDSLGFATIDIPTGSTQAQAKAAIQSEFDRIAASTVAALVGVSWQW